jgi:hypothetical protein
MEPTVPESTAIMATTTSPVVTVPGNEIGDGEQSVVAQPPLFCWTKADWACTKVKFADKRMKTDDNNRKTVNKLVEEDNFSGDLINFARLPIL